MSVRSLLLISLLLATCSAACTGSPTQTDGVVNVTVTTSTTTTSSTTTTTIPQFRAGAIGTSPTGVGVAWATVYTFLFTTPSSGGVAPYTFMWDFGDGAAGAGSAPSHAYMNTGNFTATVTATDSRGISDKASVPVVVRSVTGTWRATIAGTDLNREPIDIVQNQTAVTATINSTNGLGFASGTGNVANPRNLSVSATFMGAAPFAVTYVGRIDDTLLMWSGTVSGYPGCPCPFTATRPTAGDLSLGLSPLPVRR
jgi:hypothetical protein